MQMLMIMHEAERVSLFKDVQTVAMSAGQTSTADGKDFA